MGLHRTRARIRRKISSLLACPVGTEPSGLVRYVAALSQSSDATIRLIWSGAVNALSPSDQDRLARLTAPITASPIKNMTAISVSGEDRG